MNPKGMLRQKKIFRVVIVALMAWMLIVITGMRLPYLHTKVGFWIRACVVYPVIVGGLSYFSFCFKTNDGLTGYQIWMASINGKLERFKLTVASVLGQLLLSAFIAWTSSSITAWFTILLATTPISKKYQVIDVSVRGGPLWSTRFDLKLVDLNSHSIVSLTQTRESYEKSKWKNGEVLCAAGRTFILGTVIDSMARDLSKCSGT